MAGRYIFGPVPSRRLGRSLGIDIIPSKICSLDCVYCEVGKTTELSCGREKYFNTDDIIDEFRREYVKEQNSLDVLTVTGSGEPTLNKNLAEIAGRIKEISSHPLAILTNSTTITDPDVREALMLFDIVVPSLDAATDRAFQAVNRPAPELDINEINRALADFTHSFSGKIYLEVLLVKGINNTKEEMAAIAEVIKQCRYDMVQVNTVFRPPAYSGTRGLNEEELIDAFLFFKDFGINVEPVGNFVKALSKGADENLPERIAALLRMRPCTVREICAVFGSEETAVSDIIEDMLESGLIEEKIFGTEHFYFGKAL
ncbi:radical SAM protein [Geovibrio thiophilus]|uniref:Radical SAM protein n=1 Tax=Geovibrio thiophilus TaxID=139438 RepID=A0A410JV45_9BACT|nr:radical SAM protein [Geovibrio thiophilus]QAR32080.1 radical SAM protein [Geovibrio thiophilus]